MSDIIYPRSPRETMCGWMHLPRYIDKIRLHLAGKLHADYQPNFGKGFDGSWLKAAGIAHEQFVEVVKGIQLAGKRVIFSNLNELNAALLEAFGFNRYAILVRKKSI